MVHKTHRFAFKHTKCNIDTGNDLEFPRFFYEYNFFLDDGFFFAIWFFFGKLLTKHLTWYFLFYTFFCLNLHKTFTTHVIPA